MAMFDFLGSNDDEKRRELEENIAEIRKKVQAEEKQRRAAEGSDYREAPRQPSEPPMDEPAQTDGSSWEPAQPEQMDQLSQETGERDRTAQEREQLQQEIEGRGTSAPVPQPDEERSGSQRGEQSSAAQPWAREPEEPRAQETPQQQVERTEPEDTDAERDSRESGVSFEDIPQPPEVKDLDIPDIERGPLFITVNKFKNALATLSNMKRMVAELESSIGSLENTLEEDREIEKEMRESLNQTINDTEIIQDTVSPKQS